MQPRILSGINRMKITSYLVLYYYFLVFKSKIVINSDWLCFSIYSSIVDGLSSCQKASHGWDNYRIIFKQIGLEKVLRPRTSVKLCHGHCHWSKSKKVCATFVRRPISLLIIPEQQHQLLLVGHHLLRRLRLRLHLLLLPGLRLVLVPLQIFGGAALVSGGQLGGATRVEGRRGGLVSAAGEVLADEGGNEWLQVDGVQLTDVVEVVLDVRQQGLLLRVNVLQVLTHPVGSWGRVLGILGDSVPSGGGSLLLLMLVDESLDRRGRILRTEAARIFRLLDGLADETDGRRTFLLVLVEALAKLAYLRG